MTRVRMAVLVGVLSVLVAAAAMAAPVADLLALGFDEGTGTVAYDSSGLLNDGTLVGGAGWAPGKVGSAADLDGASYVTCGNDPSLRVTDAVTVEAWFRPNNVSSSPYYRSIVQKGRDNSAGYYLTQQGTRLGSIVQCASGSSAPFSAYGTISANQWYHGVLTYETKAGGTGGSALYVNGSVVGTGPDVGQIKWADPGAGWDYSNNELYVGQHLWNIYRFDGKIDEVGVYSRALSATEVAERYNHGGGMPVEPQAPVAVYHLDEQRSNRIVDASGNQNHGTLGYDATHTPDGKFDNGAIFDGVGDCATIPDSPSFDSITEGITIEGWAKLTSDPEVDPATNNYRMIVSKGSTSGAWDIVLEQSRQTQWSVRIDDGSGVTRQRWQAGPQWPVGDWVHFAYSYDGATGRMVTYFNGTPYVTTKPTGTIVADNYPVYLSYPNNSAIPTSSGAFPGIFDEVAIYSRALSDSDILARYNDGPPEPALVLPLADKACFHLNETTGTTAYNALGSNHGTLGGGFSRGDGMFSNAVHFDGISGHMSAPMPAAVSPTTGLTVEGWFYVDQNPNVDGNNNWRWIFNKGGWATPFDCILEQGRNLNFSLKLDGDPAHYRWNSGKYLPLNEWAHAAWTYDAESGMMAVYINGEGASHFIGATGNLATNDLDFFLSWNSGTAFPIGSGAFPGWMDEVAVYGHALSSTEILARFADGPPRTPEPATFALLGAGALALVRRRRKK